ncbi:hypothetical protein [Flavobacterium sp. W22_SRS_FP1]|uniref:hypothetical protein n=1 Tax=Flavobacterium sp. W22_SRS_FP1 TaxID=3240276 RepID=UPI003F937F12
MTLNWGSSAFSNKEYNTSVLGLAYLAYGPIVCFPLNDKIGIDFKPQVAFTAVIIDVDGEKFKTNTAAFICISSHFFCLKLSIEPS